MTKKGSVQSTEMHRITYMLASTAATQWTTFADYNTSTGQYALRKNKTILI
jgi:hypothetical protein